MRFIKKTKTVCTLFNTFSAPLKTVKTCRKFVEQLFLKIIKKIKKVLDLYALKAYNIKCREEVMTIKRKDLIKRLEANGWYLLRNGANHDIYTNGIKIEPIPRHKEVKELTAKAILKRAGLE